MFAQLDSIQQLEEVIIDSKLTEYAEGFQLTQLSDTLIKRNSASLTDVLRQNSTIYFKENGYGMVSSPTFRGTNASQTAVIWNGININSNLNGQTDFNTISPASYSNIIIRSGGGSTQYGSGAVGGSIHLNNNISYEKNQDSQLKLLYGSFATVEGNFKTIQSNKKGYFDLGVDFISSENDYEYVGLDRKNENGQFTRYNVSANTGLKLKKGYLTWNSNYFLSGRNFSGTITAPSKDNYKDVTTRNLISWETVFSKWKSTLKGGHLFERYRYYPNKEKTLFFEGKSNTFISDYMLEYQLNNNLIISSVINYTYIKADGSNIGNNNRKDLATVLLLKHKVTNKLSYGINFRQVFLNDFDNPFLFTFDVKYKALSWYAIKINISKNYRVPTFNDLYWYVGGNENLEPETSYQATIGNEFTWGNLQLKLNVFYITSDNLIKWIPTESGLWMPVNISETENYGLEFIGEYSKKFNKHQLNISGNYAYTSGKDKETNKQLIYVPYHKITGNLNYNYKLFFAYYQFLFNGEVYTTTDNIGVLDAYSISNFGLGYNFKNISLPFSIGLKINNIFDTCYENIAYRPMPSRNFQAFINFKF